MANNFSKVHDARVWSPELMRMVDKLTKNNVVYDPKKGKFVPQKQAEQPNIGVRNQVFHALRNAVIAELAASGIDPRLLATGPSAKNPVVGAVLVAMPDMQYDLKTVHQAMRLAVAKTEATARLAMVELERQTGKELTDKSAAENRLQTDGADTAAEFLYDLGEDGTLTLSENQSVLQRVLVEATKATLGPEAGMVLERALQIAPPIIGARPGDYGTAA